MKYAGAQLTFSDCTTLLRASVRKFCCKEICTVPPGEFNPGGEKRDYNTETKTVQIVATSAEHAVFFDRLTDRRRYFLTGGGQTGRKKIPQK